MGVIGGRAQRAGRRQGCADPDAGVSLGALRVKFLAEADESGSLPKTFGQKCRIHSPQDPSPTEQLVRPLTSARVVRLFCVTPSARVSRRHVASSAGGRSRAISGRFAAPPEADGEGEHAVGLDSCAQGLSAAVRSVVRLSAGGSGGANPGHAVPTNRAFSSDGQPIVPIMSGEAVVQSGGAAQAPLV